MTRSNGCGDGLELVRTDGVEAFGFQWRALEGVFQVRPDEKWLDPFGSLWGLKGSTTFLDGQQFRANKR